MDTTTTAPTCPTQLEPLVDQRNDINADLARNGVRFGVYKDGTFNEQILPL